MSSAPSRPASAPMAVSMLAGAAVFASLLWFPGILDDADTMWQIAAGGWILDHRAIPHVDPFAGAGAVRRWFAHEWLSETWMALAFRIDGFRGVLVLTAASVGVASSVLISTLRRFMAPMAAVLVLVQALANCAGSLLARPHVLAWPCLVIWVSGLVVARAGRRAPRWWLLPVMVLWVNLHGSFILGLLLALAFAAEAVAEAGAGWRDPARRWLGFTVLAWCAALLNPDLLDGVLFPFRLLRMRSLGWIGEWTPADFSALRPLELTILILAGAGLSGRLKVPPFRLLMLTGLVHMALTHWRHDQLLGLVGALLLAEPVGRIAPPGVTAVFVPGTRWFAAGLTAAALTIRLAMPLDHQPGAPVFAALDALPAELRARPVLNDYGFGAYLIAHGEHPFIDSRADMYGDADIERFRAATEQNGGALEAALREHGVAWTIFPADSRPAGWMDRMPGWRRLIDRAGVVVHARNTAGNSF